MLEALKIPVLRIADGNEADDAIGTLATRAAEQGIDATIVTADRDFFQLVSPAITVMFNRKGISDIVRYDEAAVTERFGITPSQYLDFVALKGDTSDNIPGVPGVGDKTAAKLVNQFGTVEELLANTDQLKGKQKENVEASAERLPLNKELAQIVTDVPLPVTPDDCVMGDWDAEEVRRLFTSLEFRSLFDRLQDVGPRRQAQGRGGRARPARGHRRRAPHDVVRRRAPWGCASTSTGSRSEGWRRPPGARRRPTRRSPIAGTGCEGFARRRRRSQVDPRRQGVRAGGAIPGARVGGVAFDTMLAGYLLDPAAATYPLDALCEAYLGADVLGSVEDEDEGQLFAEAGWRVAAAEAAAVALLAPVMEEQIDQQGLRGLLDDVELPLASVLAGMEARGVASRRRLPEEMGESRPRPDGRRSRPRSTSEAGEEFNLNSPPQLRAILYEQLGLQPGKKTPKGELSTDASVLEKLRDEHPIVDALLQWRELDKLNSTYLEALPRLVDPRDGRVHTTFNQAVGGHRAARLLQPQPAEHPGAQRPRPPDPAGVRPRRAAARCCWCLDYSQIELRILAHLSGDEGLREAFASGRRHPHRDRRARVRPAARRGRPALAQPRQDGQLRARVRDERLGAGAAARHRAGRGAGDHGRLLRRRSPRSASTSTTRSAAPRSRASPRRCWAGAATSPSSRPRTRGVRDLGRRQALNAPIQGSASDVFKVAMIARGRGARERPDLDATCSSPCTTSWCSRCRSPPVEAAAELVKDRMEHAVDLEVAAAGRCRLGPELGRRRAGRPLTRRDPARRFV